MTNETKEILEYIKEGKIFLNSNECKILLDYITNLQDKYDKSLELLTNFSMPCEYDEGKISHNYCEEFCDTDDETYKKCWNKYIENILRGDD